MEETQSAAEGHSSRSGHDSATTEEQRGLIIPEKIFPGEEVQSRNIFRHFAVYIRKQRIARCLNI